MRHIPAAGGACPLKRGSTPRSQRLHRLRVASLVEASDVGGTLYELTQAMNCAVARQLSGVTPASYLVVFGAGLATSLSPCTLSVLPLTIGYIGGYAATGGSSRPADEGDAAAGAGTQARPAAAASSLPVQALSFAGGLASSLALLGTGSALAGRAYGTATGGGAAPLVVGAVAVAMGLNLLGALPLRLPSLDLDTRALAGGRLPPPAQAFLAGAAFALAASPCATPVLATLLAYVSQQHNPWEGGGLLLAYSAGYVVPLLVAASATGAVRQIVELRRFSAWVTPASGVMLVAGGTYAVLSRLVPA